MKKTIIQAISAFGTEILLDPDTLICILEDMNPMIRNKIQCFKLVYSKQVAGLLYDAIKKKGKTLEEIGQEAEKLCTGGNSNPVYQMVYNDLYGGAASSSPKKAAAPKREAGNNASAVRELIQSVFSKREGESFCFGGFYQDDINSEKPIEWIILKKQGNRLIALSKYALISKAYNEKEESTSWFDCSLRRYLNTEFLNSAFSNIEIGYLDVYMSSADANNKYSKIMQGRDASDRVFLLSMKELEDLPAAVRQCEPTSIVKNEVQSDENGKCRWWLRTLGYDTDCASGVYANGRIDLGGFLVNTESAVRPAICIKQA